jgi:hypothetical protein
MTVHSPPTASDAVRLEWLRRVEAEYRSAAFTQHLTLWLIQIGAPPDLISDGLRIVADEMAHSELSHSVHVAADGRGTPTLHREALALRRGAGSIEQDVLRVAVDMFCLGETVAVRLFSRMREGCSVPEPRQALDRILKDEVVHRDFGWTLLEWLLSTPAESELRALLDRELPGMLARLRASYAGTRPLSPAESPGEFPSSDRAWGLIPRASYVEAVVETFARDYAPRFADLGVHCRELEARG